MSHDPGIRESGPGGDPFAHLDGAYVLGALDPEERAEYEEHLQTCGACRARLSEVETLLPYLSAADPGVLDEAPTPPLPDTLLPRLLADAGRAQRRRRTLVASLGALTAACLVTVAILASMLLGVGQPRGRTMTAIGPSPVTAQVQLQPTPWGTEIDLTCWYRDTASASGYAYGLTVRGADGRTQQLGTWHLTPGERVRFTAGTSLTIDQIRAIDVTDPYGTRVLTLNA